MAFEWKKGENMSSWSTFRLEGSAPNFVIAHSAEDVVEAYRVAKSEGWTVCPLGSGSNVLFGEDLSKILILKLNIVGLEIIDHDRKCYLSASAGEIWDEVVSFSIRNELSGIEALSWIPGTAGAAPVQNIGAYGQDISQTLFSVDVFDTKKEKFGRLKKDDCEFAYRSSVFKKNPGRFVIVKIVLELNKTIYSTASYPSLEDCLLKRNINQPTIRDVRETVISLRRDKLPDVSLQPNVGSFFENPIISPDMAKKLGVSFPDCPQFRQNDGQVKIPAGWLIDQVGLRGKMIGPILVHSRNALVLVNNGGAKLGDLLSARDHIKQAVFSKFGIVLEMEPSIVGQ